MSRRHDAIQTVMMRHEFYRDRFRWMLYALAAQSVALIIAGYSVNELPDGPRASLLRNLRRAHHRGATILILENVARRPVPWWDDWAASFKDLGGREDTWQFRPSLPEKLARHDKASGRDHSVLKARTLVLPTKGNQ